MSETFAGNINIVNIVRCAFRLSFAGPVFHPRCETILLACLRHRPATQLQRFKVSQPLLRSVPDAGEVASLPVQASMVASLPGKAVAAWPARNPPMRRPTFKAAA